MIDKRRVGLRMGTTEVLELRVQDQPKESR